MEKKKNYMKRPAKPENLPPPPPKPRETDTQETAVKRQETAGNGIYGKTAEQWYTLYCQEVLRDRMTEVIERRLAHLRHATLCLSASVQAQIDVLQDVLAQSKRQPENDD